MQGKNLLSNRYLVCGVFFRKISSKLLILGLISKRQKKKSKKYCLMYATPKGSLLFRVLFSFIIARMHNYVLGYTVILPNFAYNCRGNVILTLFTGVV